MRSFVLFTVFIVLSCSLTGCKRRTPEERFTKAMELANQRDTLGATLEARELIKKHPDTPEALRGRLLLAQLYMMEQRPEDALQELETVIENTTQKEEEGRSALVMYLDLLQQQKRFKDALAAVDKYQKVLANDEGLSLSLQVKRAQIHMYAGETTESRRLLTQLSEETTHTPTLDVYRGMMAQTFMADGNTSALLDYYMQEFEAAPDERTKRELAIGIASVHVQNQDYEKSREWIQRITDMFEAAMKDEIDENRRAQMALEVANAYSSLSNLPGAEVIYKRLFRARIDPKLMQPLVTGMITTLMRQGKTTDTIILMQEAGQRFPQSNLTAQAAQLESMSRQGMVERVAPRDTSTLVMRFMEDDVLTLKTLPAPADASTTGTASSDGATTAAESGAAASNPAESAGAAEATTAAK